MPTQMNYDLPVIQFTQTPPNLPTLPWYYPQWHLPICLWYNIHRRILTSSACL